MKNLTKIFLLLFMSPIILLAQNTTPTIKSLRIFKKMQGEQGVVQTIVRGIAEDIEDGANLKYEYIVLKGNATLEPVKRYAILYNNDQDEITVQLKVTDKQGASATKTINYLEKKIDFRNLYTDKSIWTKAVPGPQKNLPSFVFQERNENLPNILIIGNSISIGYTQYVQEILKGKCNVYRIPENGGDTKKGLESLDLWLGDRNWDVIHFNFGLHDLKRLKNNKLDIEGTVVASKEAYAKNLTEIVKKLKSETKAKLIWASTSVVPEGAEGRIKSDEVEYNRIAENIMKKNHIKIDDQYALTAKYPEEQMKSNVHFLKNGIERQAAQVAKSVLECLQK